MEKAVFTNSEVRATFQHFVVAKLFCDEKYGPAASERKEFNTALEERLTQSSQQPQYAIVDPESERVVATWGYDFEHLQDPQLFVERMVSGLQAVRDF